MRGEPADTFIDKINYPVELPKGSNNHLITQKGRGNYEKNAIVPFVILYIG